MVKENKMPYLAIKKVKKQFNKVEVLKGIDLAP